MCPVPLGVRAPHLAGLRRSLLARVPGAQPPTSPRRGAEAGWETAALGRSCSGAGIYPCWHLPCPLLPLNPGSDMSFRAIPCRPTPSHAVLRPLVPSKNNFLPVSHAGPPPSSASRASWGSGRAGFLWKPPRTHHHPSCEGPGEFLPWVFAAKPGPALLFGGTQGAGFAFGGDSVLPLGEGRGCLCFWGHKGRYRLWRGCWGWLHTWGTQGLALLLRGDSFGDARAGFAFGKREGWLWFEGGQGWPCIWGNARAGFAFSGGLGDGLPSLAAAVPVQAGLGVTRCPAGSSAGLEAAVQPCCATQPYSCATHLCRAAQRSRAALCSRAVSPCHAEEPCRATVQLCNAATWHHATVPCIAVQPCHVTVPCRLAVPYSCAMQPCGWGHRGAGGARRGPRRSPTRPWFLRLLGLGRVGLPLGEEAAQEAGSPLGVLPGVQAGLGGRGTTGLGGGGSCCVPGPRQVCRQLPPRFPFHLGLSWTPCPCSLCPRDPKIPRVPGHLASSRHPCPLDVPVCSHLPVSPGSPAPWPHAPSPLPAPRIKGFMQGQTSEQPESREPLPEAPETNM